MGGGCGWPEGEALGTGVKFIGGGVGKDAGVVSGAFVGLGEREGAGAVWASAWAIGRRSAKTNPRGREKLTKSILIKRVK
jgi:hypothetical protein